MTTAILHFGRADLVLRPDGTVWHTGAAALIVADLHFGKAATFRRAGVPVPERTTDDTLARLDAALDATGATQLVVLGDFFHSRAGRGPATDERIAAWRRARPELDVQLVLGNHDRHAGPPDPEWGFVVHEEPHRAGGLVWCHDPAAAPADAPALAGHIHPAVVLRDGRTGRMRCRCFYVDRSRAVDGSDAGAVLVLPAFGAFTGAARVRPREGDRVFVLGDGAVVECSLGSRV